MSAPPDQRSRSANPQTNSADLRLLSSLLVQVELISWDVTLDRIGWCRLLQDKLQSIIHVPAGANELE
jgi:hypothetical protein